MRQTASQGVERLTKVPSMNFEHYLVHLAQPVVILDRIRQVVTLNHAFYQMFPKIERDMSALSCAEEYPVLQKALFCDEGQIALQYQERDYLARVSFVRKKRRKSPIARCITFTDMTKMVNLLRDTQQQGELLKSSNEQVAKQNEQLKASIPLMEEAAMLKAQTMLLRDIHDTLGHTLIMIDALHNLAGHALPNKEESSSLLFEAERHIAIGLAELESAGDFKAGSFRDFLYRFKESMSRAGLSIELHLSGREGSEHAYMYGHLMRICQEAATNAIKHGHASKMQIDYHADGDAISLYIVDNGRTEKPTGEGHGLVNIDERVNMLFGDFSYGHTPEGGFFIAVKSPVIRDEA